MNCIAYTGDPPCTPFLQGWTIVDLPSKALRIEIGVLSKFWQQISKLGDVISYMLTDIRDYLIWVDRTFNDPPFPPRLSVMQHWEVTGLHITRMADHTDRAINAPEIFAPGQEHPQPYVKDPRVTKCLFRDRRFDVVCADQKISGNI